MADYQVPLHDMNFLLFEVFNVDQFWLSAPALAEQVDKETAEAILQASAEIAEKEIAPISRQGDETGVSFENGCVKTAPGFKAAFSTYVAGGWSALGGDPQYGGMGMPKVITACHEEMLCSADISFSLYPGLTAGAGLSLVKHGSETLKERYLTRMYAGDWTASMCLTEAHAGTDLGLIKTKAVPADDGSFTLTGSKIFITAGEHDLTENIVHLVLAKLPNAPAGPKGISLFLVPKFLINEDGTLGDFNQVSCGAIEHKMGIHASATCVINFDEAKGYLVGEENKGLACMFTMMNFERIGVGIQGLGAAERSYQNALTYAKERRQGRSATGIKSPNEQADSILVHGDVRRMLLNMKALNEGSRALSTYIAQQLDIATYGDGEQKQKAAVLVALMTPLAKAFFTDLGFENTVAGQQVFGGHGYICEWGQEQLVRDARIAQIYEGTNGIQAMDLLVRKVAGSNGAMMKTFIGEVTAFIEGCDSDEMKELIEPLDIIIEQFEHFSEEVLILAEKDKNHLGCAANDYLHVFGYVAMGYVWAKMADVSLQKMTESESAFSSEFYLTKVATAHYYFARLLPRTQSLMLSAKAGSETLFAFEDQQF